ncbi:MAG TPA: FAD-binding protein [Gammaproteobacteria bacterium]|nr:FAD-binding protein [Gammaproteobacteria bacterium]
MKAGERHAAAVGTVDLLVAGSGLAGLSAALEACSMGARVMIVTAGQCGDGASRHAQGGVAIPCDTDDVAMHMADTLDAGRGLCEPAAVRSIIGEAPGALSWLERLGMQFDDGCALEGGHSRARVRHREGDRTGAHMMDAVGQALLRQPNGPEIVSGHRVIALCRTGTRITGALIRGHCGPVQVKARAVLLATGGLGRLYACSSNPAGAFGEGVAVGVLAGAVARDMEFVQFHPTVTPEGVLLTEALRGAGARLVNAAGQYFMSRYEPELRDLAPRDVVARAVRRETLFHGRVFLDVGKVESLRQRFPSLARYLDWTPGDRCPRYVPVLPAAHYGIGGLKTDLDGRTTLQGLYAAGEVASTGLHGANRLASNSMLEALVMGRRAARAALGELSEPGRAGRAAPMRGLPRDQADWIPSAMEMYAGVSRSGARLCRLQEQLSALRRLSAECMFDGSGSESAHQVVVAELIVRAALLREESRGVHWRADASGDEERDARHLELSHDPDSSDETFMNRFEPISAALAS